MNGEKMKFTFDGEASVFYGSNAQPWSASTYATSIAKAISNLKYRFRQESGYSRTVPVDFCGTIESSNGERYAV